MPPRVTSIRPMLAVTDLPRTMDFYTRNLGFTVGNTFGDPPAWCTLIRDGQEIMFNAPPREEVLRDVPRRAKDYQIFYLNTDDVVALHAELRARGVAVTDLRVTVYGMKEFEVRDPDDYWLWFGQETDEPPTVSE
jgi:catechol 2,3-dioxygenase-like lactoylglutathione lyase family enzyme